MDRLQIVLVGLLLPMGAGIAAAQPVAVAGAARGGGGVLMAARPDTFATIQGTTVGTTGEALPQVPVRLRDARMGRDVGIEITDRAGVFTFEQIEPGSYIVEFLSDDRRVLSTS